MDWMQAAAQPGRGERWARWILVVGGLLGLWLIAAGVVRLASMIGEGDIRGWWLLVAVIEVAAGVVIVSSPRIAVSTLALLVGISFIVRGAAVATVGWLIVASSDEGAPAPGGSVAAM
jgi:uncharacterized membrane protein HdeD (DUF308 family)